MWTVLVLQKSTILMFLSFSRDKFTSFVAKLGDRCFYCFPAAMLVPIRMKNQHGGPIQISINLGKKFLRISCIRKIAMT